METIRQNGKIILHGNDGISIKMIFRNLTGKNFQGKEYADYIRHIAINSMGFTSGSIEHCRDGGVIDTGTIPNVLNVKAENPMKPQLHRIFVYVWQALI